MAIGKQPFFRAPSLPKIGRKSVSSSIFSNAPKIAPKLRTSSFNFVQPKQEQSVAQTDLLRTQVAETNNNQKIINSSLAETNRILVEIQRQLSVDFAARANEKRQALAASKSSVQKQRISAKERAIEKVNKLREGIGKAFDKVTAPARSIFDKIKEFFGIIITGILVNTAWKWLQNPKNREKVGKFFKFVADHWRWIVRIIVLGKLLGFVYRIYKLVKGLKKAADLLGKSWELARRSAAKGGGKGPGGGFDCNAILNCLKTAPEFTTSIIQKLIATGIIANTVRSMLPKQPAIPQPPQQTPRQTPAAPPVYAARNKPIGTGRGGVSKPVGVKPPTVSPSLTNQQIWDITKANLSDPVVLSIIGAGLAASMLDSPFPGPADAASLAAASGSLLARFRVLSSIGRLRGLPVGVRLSKGGTIPNEPPKKKCDVCSLLPTFSQGGTIGGRGSGKVDSVPAMLAPGEEVIRSSAANLFRPLLKDINDNAGRMWQTFQSAIRLQEKNNEEQSIVTKRFGQLLVVFNSQLKSLIQKQKLKEIKNKPNLFGSPGDFAKTGGGGRYAPPETQQQTPPSGGATPPPSGGSASPGAPSTGAPPAPVLPSSGKPYKPGETIPESATKPTPAPSPSPIFRRDNPDTQTQPEVKPAPSPFTIPTQPWQGNKSLPDQNNFISPKPPSKPQNPVQAYKPPSRGTNIVQMPMPPINLAGSSKLPSMPDPSMGAATGVPAIASFDMSNPYIMSSPQEYGVFA